MKTKTSIILFLLNLIFTNFVTSFAQAAAIYINIEDFSPAQKFPIAVSDIINQKEQIPDEEGVEIADILRRNLKLAGYFDIIPKSQYLDKSAALLPEQVNFKKWTATGARVFIKGAYVKRGKSRTLELRLYDPELQNMLVGKEYKVKKDQIHAAIHRFADEVMLALTGQRGFYSTKIAAACGLPGKEQIVIMNVDGSQKTEVTNNQAMNLSPAWSPNNTQIVFTSYLKYFPEIYLTQNKGLNDWSKPQRLTFNNSLNITPTFSPDGQSIAFASSMDGDPDIFLIDPTGQKSGSIVKNFGIDISPTWSPDGQYVAFSSERAGNLHIFVTDRSGSSTTRLTFTGYQNDTPEWSPRGDKIAFIRRASGGFNIFTMNADGSDVRQLTEVANNENPVFSPDGRYILFSRSQGDKNDLYIMMWDGSNQTPITQEGNCKTPDWSNWINAQ
ncbi:MAG: Tol-Pal system beta propeller repeat protein TolB [Deltaproteobacteria bacterium]|nr:Tol-Pal system beta propeller repeat protein TolB [Deltaproteobacteria bacterium]